MSTKAEFTLPADIINAAFKVADFFARRNVKAWELGNCASRQELSDTRKERNELRAKVASLGGQFTQFEHECQVEVEELRAEAARWKEPALKYNELYAEQKAKLAELSQQEPVGETMNSNHVAWAQPGYMPKHTKLYARPIPAQEQFCEDEGCPHYGTKHICVNPTPAQGDNVPCEEATPEDMAILNKIAAGYPAQEVPQCRRPHPHELMDGYCELRAEVVELRKLRYRCTDGFAEGFNVFDYVHSLTLRTEKAEAKLADAIAETEDLERRVIDKDSQIEMRDRELDTVKTKLAERSPQEPVCWVNAGLFINGLEDVTEADLHPCRNDVVATQPLYAEARAIPAQEVPAGALTDAERYKKARRLISGKHSSGNSEFILDSLGWPAGTYQYTADAFDAAIDAAPAVPEGMEASDRRDLCTDPSNCKRCAAATWDQVNYQHAGIPIGTQQAALCARKGIEMSRLDVLLRVATWMLALSGMVGYWITHDMNWGMVGLFNLILAMGYRVEDEVRKILQEERRGELK